MPQTPERKRIQQKEYCARPEVKERRAKTHAEWLEKNRERKLAYEANRRLTKRAQCLVATARTRATKRNLEFDLHMYVDKIQDRINFGVCEMTLQPFDLSPGRKYNSPSIDRVNPKRGYTYDNIRIILNIMNTALGDWGEDTLRQVMRGWLP